MYTITRRNPYTLCVSTPTQLGPHYLYRPISPSSPLQILWLQLKRYDLRKNGPLVVEKGNHENTQDVAVFKIILQNLKCVLLIRITNLPEIFKHRSLLSVYMTLMEAECQLLFQSVQRFLKYRGQSVGFGFIYMFKYRCV